MLSPSVEPAPSLARHALIPASLVVSFALVQWARVPPWWVACVGVPTVVLYLVAPRWGRASLARFDRDVVRMLSNHRPSGLPARYRRAVGMRLFAPPAWVAERRGLVAAETGHPFRARAAYRAAEDAYRDHVAPLGVRLGLAHACFALGDDGEAIRRYREIASTSGRMPRVAKNLARALLRRGEDLQDAAALIEDAVREAGPSGELSLLTALAHAKQGQHKAARRILKQTRAAKESALERLREEVEDALET